MRFRTLASLAGLLFALDTSAAADVPTFALPKTDTAPSNLCNTAALSISRTDDKSKLSILRKNTALLSVGQPDPAKVSAKCEFTLLLENRLQSEATLLVDLRGDEWKDAATEIAYNIRLDSQRHTVNYSRGSVIASGQTPGYRRFLVTLPPRTHSVKIAIDGKAVSLNGKATARVAVDSFDMCFVSDPGAASLACTAPAK
ncbi:hypothetical protein Jab_1c13110 [Janthinobacterium sp. HH01]|uniref:hypothetical protein n=1 Tax=Janthinobacterium sp. HH01 TaxID=1198452 RepID=UPI0002AECC23|nr:hypothetical protein [Janthinobacterium sp. HH01]ELX12696.1 hypothetical protein Jab_1c13110 [Janthinobacterium sp. HH01]